MFVAGPRDERHAHGRRAVPARAQAGRPDRRRGAAPRARSVQGLRSLDEGFVPEILDPSLLDAKYLVSNRDAIAALRDLVDARGSSAGRRAARCSSRRRARRSGWSAGRSSRCCPTAAGSTSAPARSRRDLDEMDDDLEGGVSWW